jgi:RNA polymerase sigma factor (sigma-70 family)
MDFEAHRTRLTAVARRMLGSDAEADDAVQETWLRYARADQGEIRELGAWLTTVLTRICLNLLRARRDRPAPVVRAEPDPEQAAVLADTVGVALQVVLDALGPAERVAFVLHDLFAVPYEEIAPMLGRSADTTRQLASRARRRVRSAEVPATDRRRQRAVVDAFFAAARTGDLDALVAVLHPDVVLTADGTQVAAGARTVAGRAARFADPAAAITPVLVDGLVGVRATVGGLPLAVMAFTVEDGAIVVIDTWSG